MGYRSRAASAALSALLFVIGIFVSSALASGLSSWSVVQIPGATDVRAYGINASSAVSGTYSVGLNVYGFIRNPSGSITTIDLPALGNSSTSIYGINNSGQTLGSAGEKSFIRQPDGTIDYIVGPHQTNPAATGIDNNGDVVGLGIGGGFVIKNGVYTNIPVGTGEPLGLNDSGQVVGLITRDNMTQGFLLNTDNTMTFITVPGSLGTVASGINDLGQIVGYYQVQDDPNHPNIPRERGFVRDTNGTITLFDAPQFGSTMANGISDTGTIAASFSRNGDNRPPNMGLFRKCILCPDAPQPAPTTRMPPMKLRLPKLSF